MLTFFFENIIILTPFIIYFSIFWIFFIKNNFYSVRINPTSKDALINSKFLKKIHYIFVINWSLINFLPFYLFIYFIKFDFSTFWFNHLKLNNFNINIIILISLLSIITFKLISFVKNSNVNYNIDYFSALFNLIIFVPLIFLSNTLYTFIFILEIISLIILYKFSVSRVWFNNKKVSFYKFLPKSYLNMLFFQYWANFFSSMFIMFSIFNIMYLFGSCDWIFLQTLSNINIYKNNNLLTFIWLLFFIGLFFKIGLSPLHLFKIEVYKGIPFISIFFYTTWYFISFFLYFLIIINNNLYTISYQFNFIFFIFVSLGIFYSIFLIFDVNLLKSFFAYSTIVNVLNFLIVLYLIIN